MRSDFHFPGNHPAIELGLGFISYTFLLQFNWMKHTYTLLFPQSDLVSNIYSQINVFIPFLGVRPYKCNHCDKSFTQRCSLESHTLKVHGIAHDYAYKERRNKIYVCEDCGNTTPNPEDHYLHLKNEHPYSPALAKFYDKRHFKFTDNTFPFKEAMAGGGSVSGDN